jgi:hypothetical protein
LHIDRWFRPFVGHKTICHSWSRPFRVGETSRADFPGAVNGRPALLLTTRRRTGRAMSRRRPDRAQTMRSKRQWWTRHGAFVRGMATGAALALLVTWILRLVLGHL